MQRITQSHYTFFLYFVFILSVDIADFMYYFILTLVDTVDVGTLHVIQGIMFFIVLYFCKKAVYVNKKIKHIDYIILGLLFLIYIARAVEPDFGSDTTRYHLFLQTHYFTSLSKENFFPGSFNSAMFPLGDHAFFLCRQILGYRLGTILNYIAIMVSYFQILYILSRITNRWIFVRVLSFISVLSPMVLQCFAGSYYTDLLVLPFLLEILSINIIPTSCLQSSNIQKYIYIALMAGLAIAIKMTALPYLCALILCICICESQNMKLKYYEVIYLLAILIFPFVSYMLYNFLETGNPIFPMYNSLFHSPFYEYINRMDDRFGAVNLIELAMWPFYMIIYPTYRSGSIPTTINLHYIVYFIVFLISLYKKKNVKLSLICILSLYLWAATTKENRYFCYGEVFFNILLAITILNLKLRRGISVIIFLFYLAVLPLGLYQTVYLGYDVTAGVKFDYAKWKENIQYVWYDRNFISDQMSNKVGAWIINNEYSMGLASAMSSSPVISKQYEKHCDDTAKDKLASIERYINEKYKGGIADVHIPFEPVDTYVKTLNKNGYYIRSIDYADGDIFLDKKPWICMIEKSAKENEMYNLLEKSLSVEVNKTGNVLLMEYILGLKNDYFWDTRLYTVIVSISDDNGYKNITTYNLTKNKWINEKRRIDIEDAVGKLHIEFLVGENMDNVLKDWILLVNPQISFTGE